jgi:cyclopropane-fatty-acyl-phospholipid synthase
VRAYDGSSLGPPDGPATIVVHSADALRRVIAAPGELGLARAYVAGDIDVEGDLLAALALLKGYVRSRGAASGDVVGIARTLGLGGLRPVRRPPEEARIKGPRHGRRRTAEAVAFHYELPPEMFALFLGPSMTYTCAVFESDDVALDQAQEHKNDLICRKLRLEPGMRLLDVGCGWGTLAAHATRHYGVRAVGVTLSSLQVEWAQKTIADLGLDGVVEVRQQDYRDVADGPYDAVSSVGMFEHVGVANRDRYLRQMHGLLRPGGRFLNHAVSRPITAGRRRRRSFVQRFVFPDGELQEVGTVVDAMERARLEVLHVESFRPHYARTLRLWLADLERNWEAAVEMVGITRARIQRLYFAGFALSFDDNEIGIHQVLGEKAKV